MFVGCLNPLRWLWLSFILLLVSLPGCGTTVFPPEQVHGKARVALLDHGKHTSIVLDSGNGSLIRYSYGDWNYYALGKSGIFDTLVAGLWPTQAALGRKKLMGPPTIRNIRQEVLVPTEEIILFEVESGRLALLRKELDGIYHSNLATRIYNPAYDLEFVHHPDKYWALHNSNNVVAQWLEELGCRIQGPALFAVWSRGD